MILEIALPGSLDEPIFQELIHKAEGPTQVLVDKLSRVIHEHGITYIKRDFERMGDIRYEQASTYLELGNQFINRAFEADQDLVSDELYKTLKALRIEFNVGAAVPGGKPTLFTWGEVGLNVGHINDGKATVTIRSRVNFRRKTVRYIAEPGVEDGFITKVILGATKQALALATEA